ncbi:MAG: mechanosensitive ion channel family protein [Xenococcaceae cyanobacterium]
MNLIDRVYQLLTNPPFSNFAIFLVFVILSISIGQYIAKPIHLILFLFLRQQSKEVYKNLIEPIKNEINSYVTWVLLYLSWHWLLEKHEKLLGGWLEFWINLAITILAIWIFSRLFWQFIKVYGVSLFQKIGGTAPEILIAIETIFILIVGLIALTVFASQHEVPLTGLLAGVSMGGIALSFAAQNTLQQLLGTVILFLDKPFIRGEYIRLPDGTFGRVESIGLRSTKIRTAAKNTLLIVPNSKMADWEIENVTRGKKVMVLSYLDFERLLEDYEKSLVRQIILKHIHSLFGIEPDTSNIVFLHHPEREVSRARITFFILGSSKSSIELRARIIEISSTKLFRELGTHGINYTANEPVISFDSSVTL